MGLAWRLLHIPRWLSYAAAVAAGVACFVLLIAALIVLARSQWRDARNAVAAGLAGAAVAVIATVIWRVEHAAVQHAVLHGSNPSTFVVDTAFVAFVVGTDLSRLSHWQRWWPRAGVALLLSGLAVGTLTPFAVVIVASGGLLVGWLVRWLLGAASVLPGVTELTGWLTSQGVQATETLVLVTTIPDSGPETGAAPLAGATALFMSLRRLHDAGVAHHDIRAGNVFMSGNRAGFCSFEAAESGASELAPRLDLVQALATLAVTCGPDDAVVALRAGYGPVDPIAVAAVVQPIALAPWGWRNARSATGSLNEIRHQLLGDDATVPAVPRLERFRWRTVVTTVALTVAASVTVSQLVNVVTTVLLLIVLGVLTGSGLSKFKIAPGGDVLIGLAVIAAVVLAVLALPQTRKKVTSAVWPHLREFGPRLLDALSQPLRLAIGAGANLLLSVAYTVALIAALWSVGAHPAILATAVVFLAGNAVGSATPTPGGLGGVEAVMAAGLTAIGIPAHEAIPAVLLFRMATFWPAQLPIVRHTPVGKRSGGNALAT